MQFAGDGSSDEYKQDSNEESEPDDDHDSTILDDEDDDEGIAVKAKTKKRGRTRRQDVNAARKKMDINVATRQKRKAPSEPSDAQVLLTNSHVALSSPIS